MPKFCEDRTQCPVFLPERKSSKHPSKIMQKQLPTLAQFCLMFLLCSKYFVQDQRYLFCPQVSGFNVNFKSLHHPSGIWLPDSLKIAENQKNVNDKITYQNGITVSFLNVIFFFSSLDSVPIFIKISLLVLKLQQFLFRTDLNRHSEIVKTPLWTLSNI